MDLLMNAYRDVRSSDDESSSDSDSSDDFTSIATPIPPIGDEIQDGEGSDSEEKNMEDKEKERTYGRTQMLADLGIFDLPPIEDLAISVPEQECIPIGKIHNIIDVLIIVAAKQGCPAIDLDSVLFLDHGKQMLGKVLDVFGPVSEPMYMVRFNSAQDIIDRSIEIGMEVYFAPRTKHTAYVFLDPLFQQKGSDASWENDQEPPEHCLDYSDDEEERKAKAALKNKKRTRPESNFDQIPCNQKKFQPRTQQQNSRGRGRQRGAHHHQQQRQPSNPFYMSLSNNYSRGGNAIPQAVKTDADSLVTSENPASCNTNQPDTSVNAELISVKTEKTDTEHSVACNTSSIFKSEDGTTPGEIPAAACHESLVSENATTLNQTKRCEPNENSSQVNQAESSVPNASD